MNLHVAHDCAIAEPRAAVHPHRISIAVEGGTLTGELVVPDGAAGVILCVGPRSQCAAETVRKQRLGTLRLEILTHREREEDGATHGLRFNVPLLASRWAEATRWLARQPATAHLGFGFFGEEFAGAAALAAAGELGVVVDAVVCRHSRPDFAANALPKIEAATLLICDRHDDEELRVCRVALERLHCEKQLQLLPAARASADVTKKNCLSCSLAARWFRSYVRGR